jgi:hypothetical protein
VKGWSKVKAGAQYAGVSERTFRPWLKKGLKHSRLPSGTILIRFIDIDDYLERFAVKDDQVADIVQEICKELNQ